jgi:hypothetical protein
VIVGASSLAARRVATARNAVWRAAFGALDGPPAPMGRRGAIAPTVASLLGLADAVRAARRGLFDDANTLLVHIDRERLRPEEIDLLDTVLRKGSRSAALEPDGDEPPDTAIGRATVAHAWSDPDKLAAIERALDRAGVEAGPLARLRGLVRIRQGGQRIEALRPPEARELSDEARAMGDEELASELDARARPTAYR